MTANATTEPGQAVYSPIVLGVYDWYVLGFSASIPACVATSSNRIRCRDSTSTP